MYTKMSLKRNGSIPITPEQLKGREGAHGKDVWVWTTEGGEVPQRMHFDQPDGEVLSHEEFRRRQTGRAQQRAQEHSARRKTNPVPVSLLQGRPLTESVARNNHGFVGRAGL